MNASMKRLLGFAVIAAMALLVFSAGAATPVKKKSPVKKGIAKKGATKAPAKSGPTTAAARKKAPAKKATTWRTRQLTPTPDRYREIQDALASKGYLKSEEASGAWNQGSIEALKKF